jgi:DnaJ-class molecular chaperone
MSRPPPDPYAVLGLSRDATQAEISHAYRTMLRRHHPDTRTAVTADGASGDALQQVLAAYDLLRDPERRAAYERKTAPRPAPRSFSREPQPPAGRNCDSPIRAGPVYWQPTERGSSR